MRTNNVINESIARQLVGRTFTGGTFVSHETRGGKTTLTAKCSQCGGPHSGISVTNAAQAAQNPSIRLIACQHCTFVIPTPAKQVYKDVIRIPEHTRSAAQQRIVVEHENAERNAQAAQAKQAPIDTARAQARAQTNRAIKAAIFNAHERLLTALTHITNAQFFTDPRVIQHEDYISWESWQGLSEEDRVEINKWVDIYLQNNGLR